MTSQPEHLLVVIPEVPHGTTFDFHPISRSKVPKRYRPFDLKDVGEAQTEWMRFFEEILLGIFWKLERPVPFVFRTADGTVRSLDAGCLKWLRNRAPPEVSFVPGPGGVIDAVVPSAELRARYADRRSDLVSRISHKMPSGKGP